MLSAVAIGSSQALSIRDMHVQIIRSRSGLGAAKMRILKTLLKLLAFTPCLLASEEPALDSAMRPDDTLELPDKTARPTENDSFGTEFKKYWTKVEEQDGFDELKSQVQSNDIDKSWVPRLYFFDSSLVLYPGGFIWRKKSRR